MRHAVLLRGINLGARKRVAMPALRQALDGAGFEDVRTYLQSGNVVLSSDASPLQLERACKRVIASEFGLDVSVVVRTREELAAVVARNPLADVAADPKRYQVTFLSKKLKPTVVKELSTLAVDGERLVAIGRELYAWHPHGAARSKLWNRLASARMPVVATARNWRTVAKLLELADA